MRVEAVAEVRRHHPVAVGLKIVLEIRGIVAAVVIRVGFNFRIRVDVTRVIADRRSILAHGRRWLLLRRRGLGSEVLIAIALIVDRHAHVGLIDIMMPMNVPVFVIRVMVHILRAADDDH